MVLLERDAGQQSPFLTNVRSWYILAPLVFLSLLLAACQGAGPTPTDVSTLTPSSTPTSTPSPTTPTPTATSLLLSTLGPTPTPTSTPTSSPGRTPIPSELLYSEDFEDGLAQDWGLGAGWQVSEEDGNTVLLGRDLNSATFWEGSDWTNYAFKFRLKVRSGAVDTTYRQSQAPPRALLHRLL